MLKHDEKVIRNNGNCFCKSLKLMAKASRKDVNFCFGMHWLAGYIVKSENKEGFKLLWIRNTRIIKKNCN